MKLSNQLFSSEMLREADVLAALRDCYDPTLPCNLVDLGIVRSVTVTIDEQAPGAGIPGVPRKHLVEITVTPAQPAESAAATQLTAQIVNRLAGLEAVSRTTVVLLDQPTWSPLDITPAGRRTLGLDGNRNLIQIR